MGFLVRGLEGGFLGQAEEEVGERGAAEGQSVRARIAGTVRPGLLGEEAGEDVGAGGVGVADFVLIDAAEVGAKADVVLAVDPGAHVAEGDGLRELEIGLLLAEAGELVHRDVGQAPELRRMGQAVEAELGGDVGDVAEAVAGLGVGLIPAGGDGVREAAFADGVAELQGILMDLIFAAELREEVAGIRCGVAVVEVAEEALGDAAIALAEELARQAKERIGAALVAEGVHEPDTDASGIGSGGDEALVVLGGAGKIRQRNIAREGRWPEAGLQRRECTANRDCRRWTRWCRGRRAGRWRDRRG